MTLHTNVPTPICVCACVCVWVDEQRMWFRGSCFSQVSSEPAKYFFKLWVVCHTGAAERRQGKHVELELTQGLSSHTITTDQSFLFDFTGGRVHGDGAAQQPRATPQLLLMREALSSFFGFTSTDVSYIPKSSRSILLISTKRRRMEVQDEPQSMCTCTHAHTHSSSLYSAL